MWRETPNCNTSRAKYSNYYLQQQQKVWAVDGMLMSAINETVGIRGGLVVGVINSRRRNSGALALVWNCTLCRITLLALSSFDKQHYKRDICTSDNGWSWTEMQCLCGEQYFRPEVKMSKENKKGEWKEIEPLLKTGTGASTEKGWYYL